KLLGAYRRMLAIERNVVPDAALRREAPHPVKRSGLLRLLVGIDHVAGLVLRRREHGLRVHATELLEVTALDVVVLDLQHAALLPLAALRDLYVARDGLEGGLADVVGELVVVEALGGLHRLAEDLDVGVAPGAEIVAERIDTLRAGAGLVLLEELLGALEHHALRRDPGFVIDPAVEQGSELPLDRGRLQADHRAADQFRL